MLETHILELATQALKLALLLSLPAVLAAAVVGLAVSVFQAATQLQEQSLAAVAKLIGVNLVLLLLGAWMLTQVGGFCQQAFRAIGAVRL